MMLHMMHWKQNNKFKDIMYGSKGFPIAAIILNKRHKVLSLENTNKNLFPDFITCPIFLFAT
jgi:hypothetical protein